MLCKVFWSDLPHTTNLPPQNDIFSRMILKLFGIFFSDTTWFQGLFDFTVTTPKIQYPANNIIQYNFQIGLNNFDVIYFGWCDFFYKSWFIFDQILAWGWVIELFYQFYHLWFTLTIYWYLYVRIVYYILDCSFYSVCSLSKDEILVQW